MKKTATASWKCDYQDPAIYEWRVYSSTEQSILGKLVATASASDRQASWEVDDADGAGYIRVVAATKDGIESPWNDDSTEVVSLRLDTLAATVSLPDTVSVDAVEPTSQARVTLDAPATAPATEEPVATIQVTEGSDPATGRVVAEVPVAESGPLGDDGALQVSAAFPLNGEADADKVVTLRAMTKSGRPSASVTTRTLRTAPQEELAGTTKASISGTTLVGFPAAVGTDSHEYDVTDGLRLKATDTDFATLGTDWGYFGDPAGLMYGLPAYTRYATSAKVESDELDIGSAKTFRLSIVDSFQRKSAAGFLGTIAFDALNGIPFDPIRDDRVLGTPDGVHWVGREFWTDGTPRTGVRRVRWEYVVGTSTPVAHADSDYKPYTPDQWIRGRYFRVRAVLAEPAGMHQLICPSVTVKVFTKTGYIRANGTNPFTGDQSMGTHKITDLVDPTNPQDAATRAYVLASVGGGSGTFPVGTLGKTANYSVVTGDNGKDIIVAPAGATTITLPTAPADGFSVGVMWNSAAFSVQVAPGGADTMFGGPNVTAPVFYNLSPYEHVLVTYQAAGTRWLVSNLLAPDAGTAPGYGVVQIGTGSGQAARGNHNHSGVYEPSGGIATEAAAREASDILWVAPPNHCVVSRAGATTFADDTPYASFLCRARKTNPTVTVCAKVLTAYVAGTYAEIAIFTGASSPGAAATLTRVGYTDVSSIYNVLGTYQTAITTSGVSIGDELWVVFGSKGGTRFQIANCIADALGSGLFLNAAATNRPSTMGATAFNVNTTVLGPGIVCKIT